MQAWNCCRTCLGVHNLHQIFPLPEHSSKYTEVLFNTTGMKVELNDSLPQEMCSPCISFINESYKFRRKCELAQQALLDNKYDIKLETFKVETQDVCIDISELIPEDDFKEYDDNITLDTLQYNYDVPAQDETQAIETNFDEKPVDIVINGKAKSIKKPTRRKVRAKKEVEDKKEKTERVKEEIQCEYCNKILTSKLSLRNHYKIHTGFDVVCEHCGKKFITRRLLLMHCRAKHGYEKTDKCSYCDYKASNAEQVKIHERLHTGEKPYVCKECGAGFHRKSSYLQHIAIHLPEKTVPCSQCPARFKSATLMRIHLARHRAPRYAFRCALCAGSFARRRNAARHLQRVHADHDASHILRALCPARFKSATLMRIHLARHRAPRYAFRCALCAGSFARRRNAARHLQRVHADHDASHILRALCPARFKSATLMRIHLARHRAPRYAFRCALCAGSFARRRNAARHLQRVHADHDASHILRALCPARFKSATLMRIHLARHRTPRYAFRCALCAGSFARRRNAARHLQRVHADHDASHILRFARRRNAARHLQRVHADHDASHILRLALA